MPPAPPNDTRSKSSGSASQTSGSTQTGSQQITLDDGDNASSVTGADRNISVDVVMALLESILSQVIPDDPKSAAKIQLTMKQRIDRMAMDA